MPTTARVTSPVHAAEKGRGAAQVANIRARPSLGSAVFRQRYLGNSQVVVGMFLRKVVGINESVGTRSVLRSVSAKGSPKGAYAFSQGSAGFVQRYLGNSAASRGRWDAAADRSFSGGTGASNSKTVKVDLRPHESSEGELRAMRPIYRQGRTPFVDASGRMRASNKSPADAVTTGRQLEEVGRRYGSEGVSRSLEGLRMTRGDEFASLALRHMPGPHIPGPHIPGPHIPGPHIPGPIKDEAANTDEETDMERAGVAVEQLVASAGAGSPLPEASRQRLAEATGDALSDVRVHKDGKADAAARLLGARAFTIGRSIYFASGEYCPSSGEGSRLLAHEVAHAVQQSGARIPRLRDLEVSNPSSAQEQEADRFARSAGIVHPGARPPSIERSAHVARVHRAISFERTNDAFTTNRMDKEEDAARGFRFRRNVSPLFEWTADVKINGNPGDPCDDFEVGPHQVARAFWRNVYWGTGVNRTRRRLSVNGGLPMRDATAAGNTWYNDARARAFTACGQTRSTGLGDSPQSAWHPWNNPIAGRVGNSGTFNYGFAFVAYVSARDTTKGTGADAFQHLGHVYWNFGIAGNFDASRPLGSRVNITTGGPVNRSRVLGGGSAEYPSMHGGDIVNDNFNSEDT